MSLEKYISEKSKLVNIVGLDLTKYCSHIREQLLPLKDRRRLYAEMLDMPRISSGLNSIGYGHVNGMLFDISTPGMSNHRNEYTRFVEWCGLSLDPSVGKIHEAISKLRSLYFIDGDVTLQDIEFVIDEKCISMTEKFTTISDALRSEKMDWRSDLMTMEANDDGRIKVICDDGSILVDCKNGKLLTFQEGDISHDCSIACELIKNYGEKFGTYFFVANPSQRKAIQESVRRMYLGKPFRPLKYGMHTDAPAETSNDVWRMLVKNRDVKYQFGHYRMISESVKPRIVQLESK